ncbi:hypothetical protein ACVA51_22935 [Pseudomonas luteola]
MLQTRLPYPSKDLRGHPLELIAGADVGGAAGHVAGHHDSAGAAAGAAAGCAVGHHEANKKDKAKDTQSEQEIRCCAVRLLSGGTG